MVNSFPKPYFSDQLRSDLPVYESNIVPLPGQVVIGYMIYEAPTSCFVTPNPSRLNNLGWFSVFILTLFFWPLMCVPCCINSCYDGYQVPVYR